MTPRLFSLALLLLPLAVPGRAWGCSIPVFRYALEHWDASPYEAVVFHRGALPAEQKALLRRLEEHKPAANVAVTPVDLGGKVEEPLRKLWDKHGRDAKLPWLAVRFPESGEDDPPAWAGPLSEENVSRLLDSPVRRRVVGCLGRGDSAVFVLLEGGDRRADDAVAEMLETTLAALPEEIELPEPTPDGPQLRSPLPLRVGFALLRLSRQDAAEGPFVRMLLHSEKGLADVRGPIVFPVFGRGRVLTGLHGEDLTAEEMKRAASFVCGACSCQVKRLNPGTDLLIAADWEALLDAPAQPETTTPPRRPAKAPPLKMDLPEETTPEEDTHEESAAAYRRYAWGGTVLAGLLVIVTGIWVLRSRVG